MNPVAPDQVDSSTETLQRSPHRYSYSTERFRNVRFCAGCICILYHFPRNAIRFFPVLLQEESNHRALVTQSTYTCSIRTRPVLLPETLLIWAL